MNSTIRYSHRMTFGEATLPMLLAVLFGRDKPRDHGWYDAWCEAIHKQPYDVQMALQKFNADFGVMMVKHLLVYTPLAWPFVVLAFIVSDWADVKARIAEAMEEQALADAEPEWLAEQGVAA